MATRVVVFDDHTGDPIPDLTPDDTTVVQVGRVVWEAYMAPETQDKLEQVIREFFMVGDPPTRTALMTMSRTPTKAEGIYPHSKMKDFPPKGKIPPPPKKASPEERQAQRDRIREWANGHDNPFLARQVIGDRGRIPSAVTSAYYEAFPEEDRLFLS